MDLQQEIKTLKERISESEKLLSKLEEQIKKGQEFPKNGDNYWMVDDSGDLYDTIYTGNKSDEYRKKVSNIYKTEAEAEFALEKIKVESELRKFSRPFESWKDSYTIGLDHFYEELTIESMGLTKLQGVIYFESEEKVRQAIDTVGEKRIKRYIFGVEE